MKRAVTEKKWVMGLLGLVSMVVFAGAAIDMRMHSEAFMQEQTLEFKDVKVTPRTQRFVASDDRSQLPAVQYLPVNQLNNRLINGQWEITRIIGSDGFDLFNKNERPEDQNKEIVVDFELIGTSLIEIDEDSAQRFRVSLLTEFGTILLFKSLGEGYEILEAKKIKIESVVASVEQEMNETNKPILPAGLLLEKELDLTLERALHPSKSPDMLAGDSVRGSMSIVEGTIQNLMVTLNYGNGQREEFEVGFAEINDGGQFEALIEDDVVHGIITNNGEGIYRVRFATGSLQGAMLNFVTDTKLDELAEARYEEEDAKAEAEDFKANYGDNTIVFDQAKVEESTRAAEDARATAQDPDYQADNYDEEFKDNYSNEEVGTTEETEDTYVSTEVMNEKVEESGFDFGGSRELASE